MTGPAATPAVLFLCTHNAGRSQMAMGFVKHLAGERIAVYSGGSEPADSVNPALTAAAATLQYGMATAAAASPAFKQSVKS